MEDNEDVCSTYLILPDQPIIIETVNVDIIGDCHNLPSLAKETEISCSPRGNKHASNEVKGQASTGEGGIATQCEPANTFIIDESNTITLNTTEGASSRKYKDMLRKRMLRQSEEFRRVETLRSKARMQQRRTDPEYRARERERDRIRRLVARHSNPAQREIERRKDREYKKKSRARAQVPMAVAQEIIVQPTIEGHCFSPSQNPSQLISVSAETEIMDSSLEINDNVNDIL